MDRGLKAFLAVAQEGSITAAASKINLTQSSVTKRIATLESEIGVSLFYRDRRGMSLTEAGQLFWRGQSEPSRNTGMGWKNLQLSAMQAFHDYP